MELVYLWVEDYKNIHKQGFNFSPKFNCDFDGETLTIKDNVDENGNKQYIDDFFGHNINVTAIVGKNGSGKSSLLKLIFMLIYCKKYDYELSPPLHDNIIELISPFFNKELFLIIFHENRFKKISMKYFIKQLHKKYGNKGLLLANKETIILECNLKVLYQGNRFNTELELEQKELDFFSIHFNYMIDTLFDGQQDKWIKEIYHKADSYQTPLLLEPYKNNNDRQLIDLEIIEYLNSQNMLRFYSKFDFNNDFIDFFKPNRIDIKIRERVIGNLANMNDKDFECLTKSFGFIAYKFYEAYDSGDIFFELREQEKEKICDILEKIQELYSEKDYLSLNYLYIALKLLSSNKNLFNKDEANKIVKWSYELDNKDNLLAFKETIDLNQLINKEAPLYEVRKIQVCIDFVNSKTYKSPHFIDYINENVKIANIKDILKFIPPWIDVEWFEDNKTIKSLSSGEKTFFTFVMNLMYQVQNINDRDEYKTINLFLDETELGFHPQWHKKYLIKIVEAIKQVNKNKKKVNLLFATHSPFLLSDIPKQNIIFLDTYKEKDVEVKEGKQKIGNCRVVPHNEALSKKQTFGANIHTLLSDSFFMEDGLMGEFAKGKINEIIEFHNEVEENKKDKTKLALLKIRYEEVKSKFWDIQSIIGEDYLQQVIKNHLRDTESLLGYKEAREEEIKRLRAEADRLETLS